MFSYYILVSIVSKKCDTCLIINDSRNCLIKNDLNSSIPLFLLNDDINIVIIYSKSFFDDLIFLENSLYNKDAISYASNSKASINNPESKLN